MKTKRIIIAAGGTGGHVFPGLALAGSLRAKGHEVKFITRSKDPFIRVFKHNNIEYSEIDIQGLKRSFSPKAALLPFLLVKSLFQSLRHLGSFNPSVVVGMGGYVSLPVVIAAWLKKIPVVIHEQNISPGLANRISSLFAQKIAVSFDESRDYFNKTKVIVTGNPVRSDLKLIDAKQAREDITIAPDQFVVLVFGGSQGASSLNNNMIMALEQLETSIPGKLFCIHLTGKKDYEMVSHIYTLKKYPSIVETFSNKMGLYYSAADLVVCRAGATTIAELIYAQKPAILIPYPHAAVDHQTKNAQYLASKGCAVVVSDKDLTGSFLSTTILKYVQNQNELRSLKNKYKLFIRKELELGDVV